MKKQWPVVAFAAALGASVATPGTASAYKVNGIGLGGDAALGSTSGLAGNYGFGDLELELIVGMQFDLPADRAFEADFALALGAFGTLAGNDTTNFQLGGRLGLLIDGYSGRNEFDDGWVPASNVGIPLELMLRVEHRLDQNLELMFQVGAALTIWPDGRPSDPASGASLDYGDVPMMAGVGFRYFFDGFAASSTANGAPSYGSPTSSYGAPTPSSGTNSDTGYEAPPDSSGSGPPAWE